MKKRALKNWEIFCILLSFKWYWIAWIALGCCNIALDIQLSENLITHTQKCSRMKGGLSYYWEAAVGVSILYSKRIVTNWCTMAHVSTVRHYKFYIELQPSNSEHYWYYVLWMYNLKENVRYISVRRVCNNITNCYGTKT